MISVCISAPQESLNSPLSRRPDHPLQGLLPKASAPAAGRAHTLPASTQNLPGSIQHV